jgi:transposase
MEDLTANRQEQTRLQVFNTVLERRLPMGQAADILEISERHAWRILAAYRREGVAPPAHGNRGQRLNKNHDERTDSSET